MYQAGRSQMSRAYPRWRYWTIRNLSFRTLNGTFVLHIVWWDFSLIHVFIGKVKATS
jgi:hypothetical protein